MTSPFGLALSMSDAHREQVHVFRTSKSTALAHVPVYVCMYMYAQGLGLSVTPGLLAHGYGEDATHGEHSCTYMRMGINQSAACPLLLCALPPPRHSDGGLGAAAYEHRCAGSWLYWLKNRQPGTFKFERSRVAFSRVRSSLNVPAFLLRWNVQI